MFDPDQYQLIRLGYEVKLERFGNRVVERQTKSVAPWSVSHASTTNRKQNTGSSRDDKECKIDLRYQLREGAADKGTWQTPADAYPQDSEWTVRHRSKRFLLKPTPSGQVGIFPEQAQNWDWIETGFESLKGLTGLNLFAYTGGTTLSLALQGASIVHLDASNSAVQWARQNASRSNLQSAPIRWIVEDAARFVAREAKRGSKYDILIADPPSYGKGPKRESWKIEDDLESLLDGLSAIASERLKLMILSCHTAGYDEQVLLKLVRKRFDLSLGTVEAFPLTIESLDGRVLNCGHCVRYRSGEIRAF